MVPTSPGHASIRENAISFGVNTKYKERRINAEINESLADLTGR